MRWSIDTIPCLILIALLIVASIPGSVRSSDQDPVVNDAAMPRSTPDPLPERFITSPCFIENRGQVDEGILFYAHLPYGRIAFTAEGVLITIVEGSANSRLEGTNILLTFPDSGGAPVGRDRVPGSYNYFYGRDPDLWLTDVPAYSKVVFEGLWGGIDMVYGFHDGHLKYDLIVPPGVDHDRIEIRVEGHELLSLDMDGALVLHSIHGPAITDSGLVAFHEGDPTTELISEFVIIDADSYSFRVVGRDPSRTLVIDPLVYCTYLGGSGMDTGRGIAVDGSGHAYIAGSTESTDYPITIGAFDTEQNGNTDIFVTKISKDGKDLVYSTFVGGTDSDEARGIALDGSGNAYVTGFTRSTDLPTTDGAFQSDLSYHYDAFVLKLGSAGSSLDHCTYLGGTGSDYAYGIAVDGNGSAYITGRTDSANYPTTSGSYSTTYNANRDVFVTKLGHNGTYLEYSTFVGGSELDTGYGIAIDDGDSAYVVGYTESSDFPTTGGAFDTNFNGATDAFAIKMNRNGTGLHYSTFLGGVSYDYANAVAVDTDGSAYVTGETRSFDYPTTTGAFDTTYNGDLDIFVTKLSHNGRSVLASTYLGGTSAERAYGIAEDGYGSAYITGYTSSSSFPTTKGAYKTAFQGGNTDSFITKLDASFSGQVFSSFIGGTGDDCGWGLAIDDSWNVFITGDTASTDLGTSTGAYQSSYAGGSMDAFALAMRSPPGAVLELSALAGDDHVRLQWMEPVSDGGSPISNYNVYRRSASEEKSLLETIGKTEAYIDNAVTKGVTYHYSVSAVNGVGESIHSPEVSARPASRPTAPLSLRVSSYGDGMLELKWDLPQDTGGLTILQYRLNRTSQDGTMMRNLTAPRSGFVDTSLRNGIEYEYTLYALNEIGASPPSSPISGVPRTLPNAPIWVNITAGPGSILLEWVPPQDDGGAEVINYHVHRGRVGEMLELHANLSSSETSYNDTDVQNGITYRYRLSALNSEGESSLSEERSAKPEDAPFAPRNLSALSSSRTVKLVWDPPESDGGSRITGFRIFGGPAAGGPVLMGSVGRGVFEFTNGSLTNGVTYSFFVTCFNAVGESPPSEIVTAKPLSVPSAPRELTLVSGDSMVTLEWQPPLDNGGSPITHYIVQRGWTQAGLLNLVNVTPDTRTYIDEDVENGLTYFYAVKAANEAGLSVSSGSLSAVPEGLPGPPSIPSVTARRGFVEISWSAPQDNGGSKITEIRVYRRSEGSDFEMVHGDTALQGLFMDTDVTNGVTYEYRLTSVNRNGEGPPTDILSAMPTGLPQAPISLTAVFIDGGVRLEWDPPSGDGGSPVLSYNIYRSMPPEGKELIATVDANKTSYMDPDPVEGLMRYEVTAENDIGEGPTSAPVEVTIEPEEIPEENGSGVLFIAIAAGAVVLLVIVIIVVLLMRRKKGPGPVPEEEPPVEEAPREEVPQEQPPDEDYLSDFYTEVEQEEMPDNVFNLEEAKIEGDATMDPLTQGSPEQPTENPSSNP
ncbi:MAG: fibronectin type III domain-containing protein [Candidatus Thermoplasmatota archaeon]|nr:fibronectin type III domain-containing protein [Candidatus Thermoplasmatota archaeon]